MRKPPNLHLLIPAISICLACLGHAAPITWSPAANTSGKGDLIEGTVVAALNGGATSPVITDAGASGTSSYNFTASNYTTINFTANGGDAGDTPRVGFGTNQYTPQTILSTGDTEFDSLISNVAYAFGTPSGIVTGTMTLEGLTPATDYQVQVFFNDQRNNGAATSSDTRVMTYGDGEGNTIAVAGGDPAAEIQTDHYGQFAVGTFTADATTQALTMDSSMGVTPFGNIHYSAILITGPEELNVPPQLADAAFDLADGTPGDSPIATLMGSDGNMDDTLTYAITDGDPSGVFSLDANTGELSTATLIDINDESVYSLTVEVSDGTETDTATIDITVFVPSGDAVITWGTAQNTSSVGDLLTGPVAFARNGGEATVTVAGTDFESFNLGNGFLANAYPAGGIFSTGDVSFDTLIAGFTFGGGSGSVDLDGHITGLVAGRQYSVQVFFNDQRPAQSGRIMTVSDGQGNSADIGAGATLGTGEADDYGQFVVGTFTAEAPTQALRFAPGGAGFGNSHANAILVVEGSGVTSDPVITDITFNDDTNEVSITWTSTPGVFYAIRYSLDLVTFDADIDDSLEGAPGETTTHPFTLPLELIGQPNVFYRVEPGG